MNPSNSDRDAAQDAGASSSSATAAAATPKRRRRFWMFAGAAGAMATLAACAHSGAASAAGPGAAPGPDADMGRWGRHRHRHGPMSPEEMARRIDKGVDRILSTVDASAEQKQKVASIAKQALSELRPMREQHRAARKQAIDLLSAPVIDRAALEKVRSDELQLGDNASKRLTTAMADIADVLTPDQRAKLRQRFERRMGRRWG
jgi:periplasmic protein CpxP/Spy